jgi:hypothetical protein
MFHSAQISQIWKTTSIFWQMEDDLNIWVNGRRPQYLGEWKTTSGFWKMEDDLIILANGRQPQYYGILKTTSMF